LTCSLPFFFFFFFFCGSVGSWPFLVLPIYSCQTRFNLHVGDGMQERDSEKGGRPVSND